MHNSKTNFVKIIVFVLGFILLNDLINFCFVPKGGYSRMTIREMYSQKENIDIAFIGASLTQKDINPYIIDEKLGCTSFDYSFNAQIYTGTYYSLVELFKYHKPKTVVLTTEPLSYTCKEEQPLAQLSVSMYMKPSVNRIKFYFGMAQDGSYLDSLFAWRGYHIDSKKELVKNIKDKLDEEYIKYPQDKKLEYYKTKKSGYIGKGAVLKDAEGNTIDYNKLGKISIEERYKVEEIQEKNVKYLGKIAKLCKENDSKLILITTPFPRFEVLRSSNYFEFDNEVKRIADEFGIEYYNYNLIKPEFFDYKDEYFFDHLHLNNVGATEFSKSLAEFLKLRDSGENMNKYFYSKDEFYDSLTDISNTWFDLKKGKTTIKVIAGSLYSPSITPEYRFILKDLESGEEKIIQDYSTNNQCGIKLKKGKEYEVKLEARTQGIKDSKIRKYSEKVKL